VVASFQAAHPGIQVDLTPIGVQDVVPRILTEQQNGQFNWDVLVAPASNMHSAMIPAGAFDSFEDYLVRPEVQVDKDWNAGFHLYTSPQPLVFSYETFIGGGIYANRDLVSREALTKPDQLLDPKLDGKIILFDPTRINGSSASLAGFLHNNGEDFVKKLLANDRVKSAGDYRTIVDGMVAGTTPVAIGMDDKLLQDYQGRGLGKSIERVTDGFANHRAVAVLKKAPHPNAATVWVNWFLSHDGQAAWLAAFPQNNSRRADLPVQYKEGYPDFAHFSQYVIIASSEGDKLMDQTLQLVRAAQLKG
jgi:iron(III) transport system substrate-binding protein